MILVLIILLWYIIGIVSYIWGVCIEEKEILNKDVIDSLIYGLMGLVITGFAISLYIAKFKKNHKDWLNKKIF